MNVSFKRREEGKVVTRLEDCFVSVDLRMILSNYLVNLLNKFVPCNVGGMCNILHNCYIINIIRYVNKILYVILCLKPLIKIPRFICFSNFC